MNALNPGEFEQPRVLDGKEAALRQIELLSGNEVWFRLLKDDAETIQPFGSVETHWGELAKACREGYGVYFVVNEGGNNDKSITKVRAVYVDGDDIPKPTDWHLPPSFIVQRSETRWHAYWIVRDFPVDQFRNTQKRLIARYGTDKTVFCESHVMRLAGTLNSKSKTAHSLIDYTAPGDEWLTAYTLEEVTAGLPEVTKAEPRKAADGVVLNSDLAIKEAIKLTKARVLVEGHGSDCEIVEHFNRLGDFGVTEDRAIEIVHAHGNTIKEDGEPFDLDYLQLKGGSAYRSRQNEIGCDAPIPTEEKFADAIANEIAAQPSPGNNKFRLLLPRDMRELPEPSYLIRPIVPARATILFYGAFAEFKSFIGLDLLLSTATGTRAFNYFPTSQGATVLCAAEAPHAVARKRWPSWAKARGVVDPDDAPFAIIPRVPLVADPSEVSEVIAQITLAGLRPRIVGIDTAAKALRGQDENAASGAGFITLAAERIRDEFDCSVLVVHHMGKDPAKGARGSSAFSDDFDVVFRVTRTKDTLAVALHCEKMKDEDDPDDIHLLGELSGNSLIFNRVGADEFAAIAKANPTLAPSTVGNALREVRAINGQQVTTHVLATQLCPGAHDPKTIAAMERRLRNGSTKQLAAYALNAGGGAGTKLMWTFPALDSDERDDSEVPT